ncbi:hypothetical protein [Pandoraea sp. SD6-2]|uniref:hypothetical protein n=1 Tax=Pandoraea sp. SD6-2 TaxID=1286093 RepID=UPI00032D88F0|nr:hypothetical protein [Pandoraea sp. SD6-2]EON14368.1 hypothetical protein C266_06841 [Pandoraea sp. SD6-2]
MTNNNAAHLLDATDWRFHAQTETAAPFVTPAGNLMPAGSIVAQVGCFTLPTGKTLTLPVPNATALFLNSAHRAFQESQVLVEKHGLRKGLVKHVRFSTNADAFHFVECILISVVSAYSAVEAFANEVIPEGATYTQQRGTRANVLSRIDIEKKVPLSEKLGDVLPAALAVATPRGHRCWDDFHRLEEIRNRIIHMKAADRNVVGDAKGTIWEDIFTVPAPAGLAIPILEHFGKHLPAQRGWLTKRPF